MTYVIVYKTLNNISLKNKHKNNSKTQNVAHFFLKHTCPSSLVHTPLQKHIYKCMRMSKTAPADVITPAASKTINLNTCITHLVTHDSCRNRYPHNEYRHREKTKESSAHLLNWGEGGGEGFEGDDLQHRHHHIHFV